MATAYKVLAQQATTASLASMYTVPAATETIISSIVVANVSASDRTYRITIQPNNATLAQKHYIAYDVVSKANTTTAYTLGITLDATDQVYIQGSTTDLSVSLFGSEIS
jgi:hypothetical protein